MAIAKIRRTLNDSDIGRKINGSKLGLYVEAISRGLSDIMWDLRFQRAENEWRQIERAMYSLPIELQDWSKITYFPGKSQEKKLRRNIGTLKKTQN